MTQYKKQIRTKAPRKAIVDVNFGDSRHTENAYQELIQSRQPRWLQPRGMSWRSTYRLMYSISMFPASRIENINSLSPVSWSIEDMSLLNRFKIRPLHRIYQQHFSHQRNFKSTHEGVESKNLILAPKIRCNSRSYM